MRKALFTFAIVLLAVAAQAQIKVHEDNWVSIGCLNGSFGVQVLSNGYTYFRTHINTNYSWANLSMANSYRQKHWIVENLYNTSNEECIKRHMFFVYGDGSVYCTNSLSIDTLSPCSNAGNARRLDSKEALSTVLNINGYSYEQPSKSSPEEIASNEYINSEAVEGMIDDLGKRAVALSSENLVKVFPDAVRTEPEGRLCIDYQSVVTVLVEAIKQQQTEIDLLQKTLEENGLMRK